MTSARALIALLAPSRGRRSRMAGWSSPTPRRSSPTASARRGPATSTGRPADAATQFERALRRMPNRTLSLVGLARAAIATDDPDTAREQYQKLVNQWRGADDAAILQEARAFLAGS